MARLPDDREFRRLARAPPMRASPEGAEVRAVVAAPLKIVPVEPGASEESKVPHLSALRGELWWPVLVGTTAGR